MKYTLILFFLFSSLTYAETKQIQLVNKFACLIDRTCQVDKPISTKIALEILKVSQNKIGFENLIFELKQTLELIPNNDRDYVNLKQLQLDLQSAIHFNNVLLGRQQTMTLATAFTSQFIAAMAKATKPTLLISFIGGSIAGHYLFKPAALEILPEEEIYFF